MNISSCYRLITQAGETVQKVKKFLRVMGLKRLPRGPGERRVGGVAERVTDYRIAGQGSDDSRVFGGVDVDHRRGGAGAGRDFQRLLPSLAVSGGDLMMMSTPCGRRRGRFYKGEHCATAQSSLLSPGEGHGGGLLHP